MSLHPDDLPGVCLDQRVARRLGIDVVDSERYPYTSLLSGPIPHYSVNISEAMGAYDRLRLREGMMLMLTIHDSGTAQANVSSREQPLTVAYGETAAHAVALAIAGRTK